VHGLLVPPKDSAALCVGLGKLLNDAAMREEMGLAGSRDARKYSWDEMSGRVLQMYEDTASGQFGTNGHGAI
jgi:phosphatidylinositol alpha 1,6-mannosyltransferase